MVIDDDYDDVSSSTTTVLLWKIGYYFILLYFGYMSISLLASIPAVIQEYKIWSRYAMIRIYIYIYILPISFCRIYTSYAFPLSPSTFSHLSFFLSLSLSLSLAYLLIHRLNIFPRLSFLFNCTTRSKHTTHEPHAQKYLYYFFLEFIYGYHYLQ